MKKRIHRKRGVRAEQEHDPADYGADRQKGVSAALDKALAERAHEAAVQRQTAKVQGNIVIWLVGTVDNQIEHNLMISKIQRMTVQIHIVFRIWGKDIRREK